jgi:hypothetical protein
MTPSPDFGFVHRPPSRVGDLADALDVRVSDLLLDEHFGLGHIGVEPTGSATVDLLSIQFAWDLFHERMVTSAADLAERDLIRYAVRFATGRPACEAQLRNGHGPPVAVPGRKRFGHFFVEDGDGEPFALEWFAEVPDWAFPAVDAAARVAAVERLAAVVAHATSKADLTAALNDVPAGLGVTVGGWNSDSLEFRPAMPAADVAHALGIRDVVGETHDVHMSGWHLVALTGEGTEEPRLGRWRVDAALDGWPSGGDVRGADGVVLHVAALGAEDVVRWITFSVIDA